jgi:hypothetical protein
MIFNYINSSKQKPFVFRFDQICLPGMSEDVRLSVFVHRDDFVDSNGKASSQKIVFVSDENSQEVLTEFETCSTNIFVDF